MTGREFTQELLIESKLDYEVRGKVVPHSLVSGLHLLRDTQRRTCASVSDATSDDFRLT